MDDKELLTIKEFAELSGRTTQAVYKQLNTKLSPFVKLVNNKKMLEKRALKEVFDIDIEQLKQQNNLTEEMKNTDQLYWVSMMNNFKSTAEEIVLNELIYV